MRKKEGAGLGSLALAAPLSLGFSCLHATLNPAPSPVIMHLKEERVPAGYRAEHQGRVWTLTLRPIKPRSSKHWAGYAIRKHSQRRD